MERAEPYRIKLLIYTPAFAPKVDGVASRLRNHLQSLEQLSLKRLIPAMDIIVLAPDYASRTHWYKIDTYTESYVSLSQDSLSGFVSDISNQDNSVSAVHKQSRDRGTTRVQVTRVPSFMPTRKYASDTRLANPLWIRGLCRVLRDFEPDVVHFIGPDAFWITLWIALWWLSFNRTMSHIWTVIKFPFVWACWAMVCVVLPLPDMPAPYKRPRVVISNHQHMTQWVKEQQFSRCYRKLILFVNYLLERTIRRANCVLVPSEFMAQLMQSRIGHGKVTRLMEIIEMDLNDDSGSSDDSTVSENINHERNSQTHDDSTVSENITTVRYEDNHGFAITVWPPAVDVDAFSLSKEYKHHRLYNPAQKDSAFLDAVEEYPDDSSQEDISALRKRWTFGEDSDVRPVPILVYVGRVAREKRIITLIKMMEILVDAYSEDSSSSPCPFLVIVGAGKCGLPDVHGRDKRIFVTNSFVTGRDLAQTYVAADLFVMPSEFETLGNVCLESMASGCPVVARKAGGLTDIFKDDFNGVLVDSSEPYRFVDAVHRLLKDPRKLETLAENGWREQRQFDRSWMHATLSVYHSAYKVSSGKIEL